MNKTNARPFASSSQSSDMQYYGHVDLNEVDPTSPWFKPRGRNLGQALFGHPPQELPYSDNESSSSSYYRHQSATASVKDLLMTAMDDSFCLDEHLDERSQISLLLDLVAKDADESDVISDSLEEVIDHHEPESEPQFTLKDDPEDFVDEEVVEDQPLPMQDEVVEEEEPIVTKPQSPIRTPMKKPLPSPKPKSTSTAEGSKKRRVVVTKKTTTTSKSQTPE